MNAMTNCVLCENDYDPDDDGHLWAVASVPHPIPGWAIDLTTDSFTVITVCAACGSWLEQAVETTNAKT